MKNYIKYLPDLSGELKMRSRSIDLKISSIQNFQNKIEYIEREIRTELRECEELMRGQWSEKEIEAAKIRAELDQT